MMGEKMQDRLYNMLWSNSRQIYNICSQLACSPKTLAFAALNEALAAHTHIRRVLETERACLRREIERDAM